MLGNLIIMGKYIANYANTILANSVSVRESYIGNMREYLSTQNYVGKIQDCVEELNGISDTIRVCNSKPLVDVNGIVNEDFVDLDSAKVRIVALTKAIDTNLKLLNKVLPDVREAPIVAEKNDNDTESFAHALHAVEKKLSSQRVK